MNVVVATDGVKYRGKGYGSKPCDSKFEADSTIDDTSRTRARRNKNRLSASNKTDTRYPPLSAQHANPDIRHELKTWREKFKVSDAARHARAGGQYYTAADACAGGGLSTLAAQRAGFKMQWLSESAPERRDMLAAMCGDATLIEDHFKTDWKAVTRTHRHINVLSTGMPCRDHSASGSRTYAAGSSGHMYKDQVHSVLIIDADVILIEQSDGILEEPGQVSIKELTAGLETSYIVHTQVFQVWRYGDCSNRKRLFLIGINRRLADKAHLYKIPEAKYDESRAPAAWMVADRDEDVPPWLWRSDSIQTTECHDPRPGRLHPIGVKPNIKKGSIGFSLSPHSVYSLFGTFPTMLRYGGGGRYPVRTYKCGDTIEATRLVTLKEALRVASLPGDYENFAARHGRHSSVVWDSPEIKERRLGGNMKQDIITQLFCDDGSWFENSTSLASHHIAEWKGSPAWGTVRVRLTLDKSRKVISEDRRPDCMDPHVRACAADGWPMQTAFALLDSVRQFLDAAGVEKQSFQSTEPRGFRPLAIDNISTTTLDQMVKGSRQMLLDTGAAISLCHPFLSRYMTDCKKATCAIVTAGKHVIPGGIEGTLHLTAINTSGNQDCPTHQKFTVRATTLKPLNRELLSLESLTGDGNWQLHMHGAKGNSQGGYLSRQDPCTGETTKLPLRHDVERKFWFLDVLPTQLLPTAEHEVLVGEVIQDYSMTLHPVAPKIMSAQEARQVLQDRMQSETRSENPSNDFGAIVTHFSDDRNIRAIKNNLMFRRNKLPLRTIHELFGHLGPSTMGLAGEDPCEVCKAVKGSALRMRAQPQMREKREGFMFHMDLLTLPLRSNQGNRYLICLKCDCTRASIIIPLYLRSDATSEMALCIDELRAASYFHKASYVPFSHLKGDLAGEWSDDNQEWNQMLKAKGVTMEWAAPERHHRTNPHAERMVGLIETVMKAIMMQNNMAPQTWETCANSACWLLNRLPPIGEAKGIGIGSTLPRPLHDE